MRRATCDRGVRGHKNGQGKRAGGGEGKNGDRVMKGMEGKK